MAPRPTSAHSARRSSTRFVLLGLALVTTVTAGCANSDDPEQLNTREPEVAAVSPDTTVTPAGVTADPRFGGPATVDGLAIEPRDRIAGILTDDGTTLLLTPLDSEENPRSVRLSAPGTSVSAGRDGELLVTSSSGISRVDAQSGATTDVAVDGGAASVTPWDDGYAIGTPTGTVVITGADGAVESTIPGQASVDGLVRTGDDLASLDTRQTSVTSVNVGAERLGAALRAGDGATRMTGCADGAVVVADTTDDELLVFTGDPDLIMRQRYPVAGSPFAVACEDDGTVWVTVTALNEVVGFDITSGIPVESARFPTVRQPDSLAVDSQSGELFVGSNSGAGVQVIPTRA
ncbi:hypothetical protein HQ308_00815 [Rhodococcus sp. BP-241]|uniref:hypothetical protein n=1 Tax=Rhodococcus sp. BP-241 TaxID=2739441 RepID=UPI001C9B7A64|nr:hypothetical protein [Rhodococcus sp. BP-241]MBY6705339.1 hypothetical protein [Rhodococcus sp. BP-241]